MADLKRNQLITTAVGKRFRRDRKRPNVLARYEIEGRVEFGRRAGAQDKDLLAKSVCCGLNLVNFVGGTRKAGINQNANGLRIWDQIVQHRESLGFKRRGEDVHARGVLRWADCNFRQSPACSDRTRPRKRSGLLLLLTWRQVPPVPDRR